LNKISTFGLLLILSLCIFLVTVTGCGNAAEDLAENMIESGNGDVDVDINSDGEDISIHSDEGDVKIDIDSDDREVNIESDDGSYHMTSGDNAEWPDELPNYVPKLDGNLTQVAKIDNPEGTQYTIVYEDVDTDMDSYVDDLEDEGWDVSSQIDIDDSWMVTAEHGDWLIVATSNTGDKTGALTIGPAE